jgi:hypothetical protein
VTAAQLELRGVESPEDVVQFGDRGRLSGRKCNGVGTVENGSSLLVVVMVVIIIMTMKFLIHGYFVCFSIAVAGQFYLV